MVLIIRKRSSLCEFDWEENPEEGLKQSKRVSISLKWNLSICVWERKKNNRFEITVIILRYTRNVNLLFKKDFKIAELLTKTSFFLYFRDRPKNGERNKGDVESICAKVTKRIKKCGLNLTWINYEQLIMNGFDCIFISTNNLAYLIPILMFSLVSWFLYFL